MPETPNGVVEAWLGSPGHRQNLLSPTVTELGVACVSDGGALLPVMAWEEVLRWNSEKSFRN